MEMAIWVSILTVPMLSVVDLGIYSYQKMELENAAQMAVQAAWHACDNATKLPAIQNCTGLGNTGLLATMRTAAQNTTLGSNVTIAATTVTEAYYCSNNASPSALVMVGTAGTLSPSVAPARPSPNDCHTVLGNGVPGDYIQATASYPYAPLFSNISIASLLTTPITRQAWMRLD